MKRLVLTMSFLISICIAQTVQADTLNINVENLKGKEGNVVLVVFDSDKGFKTADANQAAAMLQVRAGMAKKLSLDLPKGNYAVMAMHDANSNQEFDMQGMMPLEGFAYSNGVGTSEEASFADAAFELDKEKEISLKLTYYK